MASGPVEHRRARARAALAAAALASVAVLATTPGSARAAATPASWLTATTGNWDDPTRWSTNPAYPKNGLPNAGDTYAVTIAATGSPYTATLSTPGAPVTVDSLTLNSADATLAVISSALTVNGASSVQAGMLRINAPVAHSTLTAAGGVNLSPGGTIRFAGSGNASSLATLATPAITGTGQVAFDTHVSSNVLTSSGNTLTLGSGITVRTGSGGGQVLAQNLTNHGTIEAVLGADLHLAAKTFVNSGTIRAANGFGIVFDNNYGDRTLLNTGTVEVLDGGVFSVLLSGVAFTNDGTITVNQGRLLANQLHNKATLAASGSNALVTLAAGWTNTGTITGDGNRFALAVPGAAGVGNFTVAHCQVDLLGDFAPAQVAAINATSTRFNIKTGTLDNVGNTLLINTATKHWTLTDGGSINGGSITGAPLELRDPGFNFVSTLSNVDLQTDVLVSNGTSLRLQNTPLNNRTVRIAGTGVTNTGIVLTADQVFTGANSFIFDASGGEVRGGAAGLVLPASVSISTGTGGGRVGLFPNAITLNGTVTASTSNRTIAIEGSTVTNNGALSATTGGTIQLAGNWTNNGTITANGARLRLGGTPAVIGSITATNSTVTLFSSYTADQVNSMSLTNSAIEVASNGVLDNTGRTFVHSADRPFTLTGGTFKGGTFTGEDLVFPVALGAGTLDGVTLDTDLIANAQFNVTNGLTLSNGARISIRGGNGRLHSFSAQTIGGTGEIVFDSAAAAFIAPIGALTIGPGVTVRTGTQGGGIGNTPFSNMLTFHGTASSQTPHRTFSFLDFLVTSTGLIEARNGGTMSIHATLAKNYAAGTLTGGKWAAHAGSTLNITTAAITTNAADVLLSGAGSVFAAIAPINHNKGVFAIADGRDFTTAGALSNTGKLVAGVGSDLTIAGDLTEDAAATFAFELKSNDTPEDFGQALVSGAANLAGTLEILRAPGDTLEVGDTFTLLTASSVDGAFALALPPGMAGSLLYSPTTVTLHLTAVPEPTSAMLLPLAAAAATTARRRRRA